MERGKKMKDNAGLSILAIIALVCFVLLRKMYDFFVNMMPWSAIIVVGAITLTLFIIITRTIKERKISRLQKELMEISNWLKTTPITKMSECIDSLLNIEKELHLLGISTEEEINRGYGNLLTNIIIDKVISQEEFAVLGQYEEKFNIDKSEIAWRKRDAFSTVYEWAIKDKVLTQEEETILKDIFSKLKLDSGNFVKQSLFLEQLRGAREILEKTLEEKVVDFKTLDKEKCYFVSAGTYYKSRQSDNRYYPEYDSEVTVYITNKRVVLNTPTFVNIPFSNIRSYNVVNDEYIVIYTNSRVKPVFIEIAEPYIVKAIMGKVISEQAD